VAACALIVLFAGETTALIPLYATAIFTDFTISQSGMVLHWRRHRTPGWQLRLGINAVGAVITGIILVTVAINEAPESLLVLVVLPIQVGVMWYIRREYDTLGDELALPADVTFGAPEKKNRVIIPVPALTRAVIQSVQFGRSLSDDVKAVHLTADLDDGEALRSRWERVLPEVPLVIVETPFRSLVTPFLHYLDVMAPSAPDTITIVVLPEYVPRHWWDRILYNQTAARLKRALVGRRDTVVADVPFASEHTHRGLSLHWPGDHEDEHPDDPARRPDES